MGRVFEFVVYFLVPDKLCLSSFEILLQVGMIGSWYGVRCTVKLKLYVLIVVAYMLGFSPVKCEVTLSIHSSVGSFRPFTFHSCCQRVTSSSMWFLYINLKSDISPSNSQRELMILSHVYNWERFRFADPYNCILSVPLWDNVETSIWNTALVAKDG